MAIEHVRGTVSKVKGAVKGAVGKLTGSKKMQAERNVSTTLIHPGLEFKLGSGHMAPPFVGQAGSGLPEGKIACADPG